MCSGGKKSATASRASSVSAEPPKLTGSGRRSGIDTSVTYNRRQTKPVAAAAAAASVSVNGDEPDEQLSASTSTASQGRHSAGNSRELRKPKPADASTPAVETVKRKISSEWDDCRHFLYFVCGSHVQCRFMESSSYFISTVTVIA